MTTQFTFWMLIAITILLLLAIFTIGNSIVGILKSDYFKRKLKEKNKEEEIQQKKDASSINKLLLLGLTLGLPSLVSANSESNALTVEVSESTIYLLLTIDVILIAVLWYLKNLLLRLLRINKSEKEFVEEKQVSKSRVTILQALTDAVPIEEEDNFLMDHEYDGIHELDNNLPPWWIWGFYLSIFVGVLYLFNYHVFGIGDLQEEEYNKEIARADKEVQEYLESQAMNVDERTVTLIADAALLREGEELFQQFCKVCHGANGEGLLGPNLTDEYWLYGGDISSVFKTIKYGAERGMKSWKDELSPVQIQRVASFIITLNGTNPENAKAPEGEKYIEVSDSIIVE